MQSIKIFLFDWSSSSILGTIIVKNEDRLNFSNCHRYFNCSCKHAESFWKMTLERRWAKNTILVVAIVGLLVALLAGNKIIFNMFLIIIGIIIGRVTYLVQSNKSKKSNKSLFSFVLLALTLAIISLSTFSKELSLLFLGISAGISYYAHLKKLVGNFKSKDFIK